MPACRYCAESIPEGLVKCPKCGETLEERAPPPPPPRVSPGRVLVILGAAVGLCVAVPCVAAIVIPNVVGGRPRRSANEPGAIGDLKAISVSQTLFREGDKEGDQVLDYGTLAELSDTSLIDGVLGSGTKRGYTFQVLPSPTTPELLWIAVANPVSPTVTGDRYFVTNHAGVIYYSRTAPFPLTPDASIPTGATPVGR